MTALVPLVLALAQTAAPALTPGATGTNSIEFLSRYCLGESLVAGKKALMESEGWREEFDPAKGWPAELGFRVFRNPIHPHVILLSSPQGEPETVRDCVVDGDGIDARQLIDTAISRWGAPARGPNDVYYWPLPAEASQTVLLAKSLVFHDPNIAAFSLRVRFGPSEFPTKED